MEFYLFFLNKDEGIGDSRWVIEGELGKSGNYGYIRSEGTDNCPEAAGQQWSHVWNQNVIDANIKILNANINANESMKILRKYIL